MKEEQLSLHMLNEDQFNLKMFKSTRTDMNNPVGAKVFPDILKT
jgi:hypothetical protein